LVEKLNSAVERHPMAGTVKHARLESPSARKRLPRGRQPHWQGLIEGRVHLGYQCWKGEPAGRWIMRRYIGISASKNGKPVAKYSTIPLGLADDDDAADGTRVLSFEQAEAKAHAMVAAPNGGDKKRLTVRKALDQYVEYKRSLGQPVSDVLGRGLAHIVPPLGNLVVTELTAETLRKWLATMAAQPAQKRPKAGKPQFRLAPDSTEAIRARRASANRVLTMLKAALNYAFDEGYVANRDAWGRKLKPFKDVEVARVRYLTVTQAERLLNACDADFRPLVRAALETGCRYSELARMQVQDFNPDSNTVTIGKSKSGKARHVILTPEGADFFSQHCAGRDGIEPIFHGANGSTWNKSHQAEPMRAACARARITPPINFHALRHTWASLATMNGVPLLVVAKNLGHIDTRMVEKHYSHLAPSYVAEAIRAGAPRFIGADTLSSVVPMPAGKLERTTTK
jgi:integrase